MAKLVKVKKTINVKSSTKYKGGKKITRKAHTRTITQVKKAITKKEYQADFNKRSAADKKRDLARTAHKKLITGSKNKISPKANTKNIDWLGVDAKGYSKINKTSATSIIKSGLPAGYTILKVVFKDKRKVPKYRAMYHDKPIAATTLNSSLQVVKGYVKNHHGRITGNVTNTRRADAFHKSQQNLWKGKSKIDDYMEDEDMFDKSNLDDDLEYGEKRRDYKTRFSMRNQDNYNRL